MNDHDDDLCSDGAIDELEMLFSLSVRCIIREEDPEHFLRWFRDVALRIAPEFFNQAPDDPDASRSLLTILGREIWNKTPLPWNQFRPHPLPKPERNALCICGSGRKYKQCCVRAEQMDAPFGQLSLLSFVLDNITAKARQSLPYTYLNPEELAFVAKQWMEAGREKEAVKLLEGLFADFSKLDERADSAFDLLLDGYDLLNNPLKKKRLLERGRAAPNKYLQATAMQRQCCMLADRNEFTEGWALFQKLQRLVPNDPSLSHLEIVMLLGQGEKYRAAERAKFWVARLTQDGNVPESLLEFLRTVAKGDATDAMTSIAKAVNPELEKLIEIVANLPKPTCHYTLKPMEDSAGPLMPDAKVRRLNQQWELQSADSMSLSDDLDWLEKHPIALQSFEILDDWLVALEGVRATHGFEEVVLIPLLQHAEALLRMVLAKHHAENLKLEWGWHENRPALSLLERLAMMLRITKRYDEAVRVMEWMVLTLNPNDNQGMRELLIHDYLRIGRTTAALDLAKHFPDDMASMSYGAALALFIDKQETAATKALKIAAKRYPEVRKMLLANNPKQPKLREGLVSMGGKDEAWYYRQDYFGIWQNNGGLEWLRKLLTKRKK